MIASPMTPAMPRDVANACKLLIALILLHATYGLVQRLVDSPPEERGINLLIGGIVFALLALPLLFLQIKISQRRNWARWMLFAVTLVETLSTFATLRESWNESAGDTVVSVISAMILIAVIGLLFARVSNDWFANQATPPDTPLEPDPPDADPRYVTSLGYPCPCCGWKIAFLSRAGSGLGRLPKCPSCNHPLKPALSLSRMIVASLLIVLPLRMAGTVVPALAFLNGSLSKMSIFALAVALALHFKPAPQE
ncbi:hypothetical protein GCM10007933_37570 [Zoogloea oryzae]|uniref:Uncharacterized protein n=2 Tax=Zoogloea oryzae TaxID=310767 RepID=A0ABQ6FHJ1_9RHOO|nr:hypothetical protein GCM10007933_37570 [Zoogloea oryzae]